jgi:TerC family integral membrane protein
VHIHPYVWIITIVVMLGLLLADALILGRRPHMPSMKECAFFIGLYVVLAVLFGTGVTFIQGPEPGKEFFAVWLTEYSLSLDNLFIFIIVMNKFKVPGYLQQFTLLVGIIVALVFRGVFIALGQVVLNAWAWVFFIFGAFLLYSAIGLLRDFFKKEPEGEDEDAAENLVTRWMRTHLPTTGDYRGTSFFVKDNGKILATSLLTVVIALSTADLIFRAGLDPGQLRAHQRGLSHLHRQRLRPDGAASAVLPARQPAAQAGLPAARPLGDPRLHLDQADPARPQPLRAGPEVVRRLHRDLHGDLTGGDRRHPGAQLTAVASILRSRYLDRSAQ